MPSEPIDSTGNIVFDQHQVDLAADEADRILAAPVNIDNLEKIDEKEIEQKMNHMNATKKKEEKELEKKLKDGWKDYKNAQEKSEQMDKNQTEQLTSADAALDKIGQKLAERQFEMELNTTKQIVKNKTEEIAKNETEKKESESNSTANSTETDKGNSSSSDSN